MWSPRCSSYCGPDAGPVPGRTLHELPFGVPTAPRPCEAAARVPSLLQMRGWRRRGVKEWAQSRSGAEVSLPPRRPGTTPPAEASRKRCFVPSPGRWGCRLSSSCVAEGTLRQREYFSHVSAKRREKSAPRQPTIPRTAGACLTAPPVPPPDPHATPASGRPLHCRNETRVEKYRHAPDPGSLTETLPLPRRQPPCLPDSWGLKGAWMSL